MFSTGFSGRNSCKCIWIRSNRSWRVSFISSIYPQSTWLFVGILILWICDMRAVWGIISRFRFRLGFLLSFSIASARQFRRTDQLLKLGNTFGIERCSLIAELANNALNCEYRVHLHFSSSSFRKRVDRRRSWGTDRGCRRAWGYLRGGSCTSCKIVDPWSYIIYIFLLCKEFLLQFCIRQSIPGDSER